MKYLKWVYEKVYQKKEPYYYDYSVGTIIMKPIRKWLTNVIAANCPFNCVRIFIYRRCGFKIGKHTFIGMRCYLDDMGMRASVISKNCVQSGGIKIGTHATVGACTLVNRNIPENASAVGVPCRIIVSE